MNVPVTIACPVCGVQIASPEKYLGKQVKCRSCGKLFRGSNQPGTGVTSRRMTPPELPVAKPTGLAAQAPSDDLPGSTSDRLTRRLFFVAVAFAGTVALGIALYVAWDLKATSDAAHLKNEVIALAQNADQLKDKGQLRQALDAYELVIAKGRSSADVEIREKVEAATDRSAELRTVLKDELEKEVAERERREEEERVQAARKRQEEEERQKALAAEMEAKKQLEAERLAEETRKLEAIKVYTSPPAVARSALNAIKKLNARTEVGINYRDYGTVVGETWAEVKVFADSPEGKQLKEFSELLVTIVDKYRLALDVWKDKFDSVKSDEVFSEILLQECWRAAGVRLKVAEGLLGGDQLETHLSSAIALSKLHAEHEITIKKLQIKLIGLKYSSNKRDAVAKEIDDALADIRAKEPSVK